jgi:hypothetical protein
MTSVVREFDARTAEAAARYGRLQAAPYVGREREAACEALRAAVTAYADVLRRAGHAPEQAVVRIKAAVESAFPLGGLERRAALARAVTWAVEVYYQA